MSVLVAGGAGYIGSETVRYLLSAGRDVVVADDLRTGHREALPPNVRLYCGDIRDGGFLDTLLSRERIDSAVHFAAFSLVGESMTDPLKYYENNLGGTVSLLGALLRAGVKKLVFSSTAAVYGQPDAIPITENAPTLPTNVYGETKLVMEKLMGWVQKAHGLRYVALRYFNACGASADGRFGEDHSPETHLIPLVLKAAASGGAVRQFGSDYPTPDGTCIRDYVHVTDLARAHALALDYLDGGGDSTAINLGTGCGMSVAEMIRAAKRACGVDFRVEESPRRAGDPAVLVASGEKAASLLGWRPECSDPDTILQSAWRWHFAHPNGYCVT